MKIIGTGLAGLIGSRIIELLSPEFSFLDLSKEQGIDITDYPIVNKLIEASEAPWIFHLAAYTDVDGAEKEKESGEKSQAWLINVSATENLVNVCQRTGKRLLYLSTDYVFAGTEDFYTEEDEPHPQGWYAVTKYEGEKRVAVLGEQALIVRTANPYRAAAVGKLDFVHKIISRLATQQEVVSPNDQLFVPTFIDDLALALKVLITGTGSGIYHVVGDQALSPYEAALTIAKIFGFSQALVKPTTFAEFFAGRAPRPLRAVLKHDKIDKLGIKMRGFTEGLAEVKRQLKL